MRFLENGLVVNVFRKCKTLSAFGNTNATSKDRENLGSAHDKQKASVFATVSRFPKLSRELP